ncbi:MAG TPA: hypothetical protein PLK63_08150 [Catalimonadaceae bacterium]|nr:hypothetical protein [Catalimonadaceae bacterium]
MPQKLKTAEVSKTLLSRIFVKQVVILVVFGLAYSCSYFDPEVEIPSYIQIDTFSFQSPGPDSTGFPTQKISEVWLYANNQVLGVYELPTGKIPVLASGKTNITVQAGVYTDGVRKNRVYYPFYRAFETEVVLEKEKTTQILPHFSYTAQKKKPFNYFQDFESSDSGTSRGVNGTVYIDRLLHSGDVTESQFGNRYARLSTSSASDVIEFSNNAYVPMPVNGNPVYLEFDYKSTCSIYVGVHCTIGGVAQGSVGDLVLNANEKWTKIYVSLSEETNKFSAEASLQRKQAKFRFFLKTLTEPGAGNNLCIDNVRLIY